MADLADVKKNLMVGTTISTAKSEFEARLGAIDSSVRSAILNGAINTVDFAMYSTRHLGANTTIELMQSSDAKKVGITNLNKRQMEANTYALITGIQLLSANAADATDATISGASYGEIADVIANGELEIKVGDKVIFPRNSCSIFKHSGGEHDKKLVGYYELECPKFLQPLTDIVPTLWLPKTIDATAVKIIFHGVKTNKA